MCGNPCFYLILAYFFRQCLGQVRSSSASDRECRAWFHHQYSQQLPTATLKLLRGRHENNTGIKLQLVYSNIDLLFNRLENVLWFKQQVAIVNFSGNFWLLINVDFSYEFCVWPNIVSSQEGIAKGKLLVLPPQIQQIWKNWGKSIKDLQSLAGLLAFQF